MKIIKHMVMGLILFALSFSLMFLLTDKSKYQTVDNYVKEPRVYVTKYGDCYHTPTCHYLRQSKIEKGLYYAKSHGYKACSYCKGTPCGSVEVNYYKTEMKNNTDEVVIKSMIVASFTITVYISVCMITYVSTQKRKRLSGAKYDACPRCRFEVFKLILLYSLEIKLVLWYNVSDNTYLRGESVWRLIIN